MPKTKLVSITQTFKSASSRTFLLDQYLSARATLFVVLSFITLMSSKAHSENLLEVYQQAQQNDHEFRAAQADYRAEQENKRIGRSGLLPQINARVFIEESDTEQQGVTFENPAGLSGSTDETTNGYNITLEQPLFNLRAWYQYKNAKTSVSIAQATLRVAEQSLILRTSEAYFEVLRSVENLSTSKAEEKAFGQQLEQAKQRFEVGLIAITEVHEAEAAYDSSRAEKINAQGAVGIAFQALEVLTGQYYKSITPFKEQFSAQPLVPNERQEWIDMTTKNSPELQVAALTAKSAKENVKIQKSDHFPTVTGTLSYNNIDTDEESNQGFQSEFEFEEKSLNITLNVPIYSGGNVSARSRQASKQSIAARERFLQTQRDVVQRARSLHLNVRTGVATVQARRQAIVSNNSAFKATKAGYDVGTRDLVDVLNAQRNLYRAERDYDNALYDYVINALNLKASAGVLAEKDLTELTAWLNEENPVFRAQ